VSNSPSTTITARRSPLERALGLFTEVRGGEGVTVLALAFNVFLILTTYYLIKPVREALILSVPGGPELKSYSAAGQALLLLVAVPAYGWLASRVPRMRLIDSVTLLFAACLVGFYVLVTAGAEVGVAFFLWVGIFNLMVPAQFWAFANDIYNPDQGKRLFVLVAFGASTGAVFGSLVAEVLIPIVGVSQMLLVAAGVLASTLLITHYVNAREHGAPRAGTSGGQPDEAPIGGGNAFAMVLRNRYLLLLAIMLLLNNWVNSNGEYILGHIVKEAADANAAGHGAAEERAFIAEFYAVYFGVVNLAGMLLQLFVVSRVIKYIGVPVAICLLPAITLGSYAMIVALPVLGVVRWVKTAENSTDYSLQSTLKQVLYLPTTRAEKYKAKQAIDTFFVRAGDLCSAGLVLAGTHLFTLGVRGFAIVTIVLCAAWLAVSVLLGRRFKALVPETAESAR
jgi:AAA family ATP:ADP antiporter